MKKHFVFPLILLLCLIFCIIPAEPLTASATTNATVCKNTFRTVDGKIYYYNSKGTKLKKTWKTIQNKRYYFYSDGHAATGSSLIGKKRYLFSEKGILLKNGFHTVNGKTYYTNSKGRVTIGFKKIKKKTYCFNSSGAMRTGWYKKGSKTYYLNPSTGVMTTGWKTIDGNQYHFNSKGIMSKNTWIKGKYLNKNGVYDPEKKDSLAKLEKKLRSAIKGYSGSWSIYVKNLDSNASLCINNKKIYAASLIKLYTMAAAYEKIDQGKLKLSSVKNTIHSMISVSSNDAFNTMLRKIGKSYTNKWCKANGYTKTRQVHGCSPSSNNYGLRNGSGSNVTTVKDCGKLLETIYRGTCVSKSASKKMLSHLKAQERRWKIPAGVPSSVTVANKTGETDDTTHDAAIVYSKGADYIIVVMAKCPGHAWYSASNITKLSRITYNYFN